MSEFNSLESLKIKDVSTGGNQSSSSGRSGAKSSGAALHPSGGTADDYTARLKHPQPFPPDFKPIKQLSDGFLFFRDDRRVARFSTETFSFDLMTTDEVIEYLKSDDYWLLDFVFYTDYFPISELNFSFLDSAGENAKKPKK